MSLIFYYSPMSTATLTELCLEELAVPEIAELLGIPGGTVASRLRRAREAFHKAAARLRAARNHAVTRNAAKVMP